MLTSLAAVRPFFVCLHFSSLYFICALCRWSVAWRWIESAAGRFDCCKNFFPPFAFNLLTLNPLSFFSIDFILPWQAVQKKCSGNIRQSVLCSIWQVGQATQLSCIKIPAITERCRPDQTKAHSTAQNAILTAGLTKPTEASVWSGNIEERRVLKY